MKKILITGGSGLVGRKLTQTLTQNGYEVAWLSRSPEKQDNKSFFWNPYEAKIDVEALAWADGIIHLAGAPVAEKKWTQAYKQEIEDSRVIPTEFLAKVVVEYPNIKKVIGASAIGIYPSTVSNEVYDVNYKPKPDAYLQEVTIKWEEAYQAFKIPVSLIRVGIVLSLNGGALAKINKIPLANPLGSGKQNFPWIHITDLVNLFVFALQKESDIVLNGVTKEYTSQADFAKTNAKYKKQLYLPLPVPLMVLELTVGEMAKMLVNGVRISPKFNQVIGFKYRFPSLEEALKDLYTS